jgi:hypothetical protein
MTYPVFTRLCWSWCPMRAVSHASAAMPWVAHASHCRVPLQVFGVNPERVVDGFSEEFEEAFMDHLRRA